MHFKNEVESREPVEITDQEKVVSQQELSNNEASLNSHQSEVESSSHQKEVEPSLHQKYLESLPHQSKVELVSLQIEVKPLSHQSEVESASNQSNTKPYSFQSIDDLLSREKWYSKHQLLIQGAFVYLAFVVCWYFVLSIFTSTQSSWQCVRHNNTSSFCKIHVNETFRTNHAHYKERCHLGRSEWTFTKPKEYSFVTEFDLVCEKSTLSALISSSYYIGGFFGSLLGGNMADKFGRKSTLMAAVAMALSFSVGGSFVTNVWQLFVLNIFVGGSSVAVYCGGFVYLEEYAPPYYRPYAGMLLQVSMSLSYLAIDWFASYGLFWRQLKFYSALPSVMALLLFLFLIPESPRWLLTKGRYSGANAILNKLFKKTLQLAPKSIRVTKETAVFNYTHLFRSAQVALITLRTTLVWFTLGLSCYMMYFSSPDLGGNMYLAFAFTTIPSILSCILSPYLANRIGRKKTVLLFMLITAMTLGCKGVVTSLGYNSFAVNLTIVMTAQFFCIIAFCTAYTWTFEIFPTCIRSQGVSLCILSERIGICIAPFMTEILLCVSNTLPYLIVCGLGIATVLFSYRLPETKGLSTRESYSDFYVEEGKKSLEICMNVGVDNKTVECES